MPAKYLLAIFALCFLVAGALASRSGAGQWRAGRKTWLLIGAIFAAVSLVLHFSER